MSAATIIHNLPWADYIQGGFLGSSALDEFPRMSREAWSAKHQEGNSYSDDSDSKAVALGSALDCLVTDPLAWDEKFAVRPDGLDGRTKEGKAWAAEAGSRSILTADEHAQVVEAHKRVMHAIKLDETINHGTARYQVTFRGEINGINVQTRPDIWIGETERATILTDLKYVNSTNFDGFDRQFVTGRYFLQAGLFSRLYRDATGESVKIAFLLAESGTATPRIREVAITADVLSCAEAAVAMRCQEIADRREEAGGFVDRPEYSVIELPGWARAQIGLA